MVDLEQLKERRRADVGRVHRAVAATLRDVGAVHMGAALGALLDIVAQVASQAGVSRGELHRLLHGMLDRYECPCADCKVSAAGPMVKGGCA